VTPAAFFSPENVPRQSEKGRECAEEVAAKEKEEARAQRPWQYARDDEWQARLK